MMVPTARPITPHRQIKNRRNYDCLSVLRLEEGESAYIEMQKHEKNTQLKHPIYGYSVGIRGLGDKIQKNMN